MNIENYPSAIVSIYNRNGFLVYSKMNYQNDWAGTFDQTGDLLPAGSYSHLKYPQSVYEESLSRIDVLL